ncbi:MAG: TldD/PmbA family protein [Aigarchaeota archaeon]|nr:TldD/PmbA family protein [Candidatus Caldarchaeales archaeon]MDJ0272364.1 TldD/PmbA family protein [Candidatus Caldarchaeales archaeon]
MSGSMDVEDLLEFVLKRGGELGASYVEARFQRDHQSQIVLKNGVPEVSADVVERGVGVRLLYRGSLGFAYVNQLDRASLRKAVAAAFGMAKAASTRSQDVKMSEEKLVKASDIKRPRIRYDDVDNRDKIELLKEADDAGVEAADKLGVKLVSRFIELGKWSTEKHVVNSDGGDVRFTVERATANYIITAYHPQRGVVQRFENLGESSGWEAVERWDLPGRLAEEARDISKALLKGVEPPREPVDVVLGSEIVGLVCHESCGHPGEADRMLGREAAQAGETYVKPELFGTRIGSEHVTVVDDPRLPRSFGYYLYDDECVATSERVLIDKGVLSGLLHNRETAAELGTHSNGASRANSYSKEPIVRMANTYLKPGDHSLEELFEIMRNGVYIKSYQEWNIDDRRWNQRYVGVVAYRVRDGKLAEMIRDPVVDLTTKGLWSSVKAVADDLKFYAGYCGKGDPMQGIPVWFGGPSVLLSSVRLGVRRPA